MSRCARALTFPLADEARTLATREAIRQHSLWTDPALDAGGLPVLLVGGMASTPPALGVLHEWLQILNCHAEIACVRYGVDCGERSVARLDRRLADITEATGRRCVIIAHSRGGQFARAVTARHPERVRGLITMGSPMNRILGVHPLLKAEVAVLGMVGTLGVPGFLRAACLWGECCRRLRDDLGSPLPDEVSFLSLYSRRDRIVDWRSCLDPAARHGEVDTTHAGFLSSPAVFSVIVSELGRLLSAERQPAPEIPWSSPRIDGAREVA